LRFWWLTPTVPAMRSAMAQRLSEDGGEELLSTGEVASLLGVSRQHVVDLCEAGNLPYSWVGKHRRIRRRDAEHIAAGNHRATRDQVRSLLLAYAIAGRVVADPERSRALARENLRTMRESSARGATQVWIREWERLLDGPLTDLLAALTSPAPRSRELRQNNPFAGVLSDEERRQVLQTARSAAR
jgi:excisionase family DNA binding protein